MALVKRHWKLALVNASIICLGLTVLTWSILRPARKGGIARAQSPIPAIASGAARPSETPDDVLVRGLIDGLEAKAAAMTGTWTTTAAWTNIPSRAATRPSEQFVTSVMGDSWSFGNAGAGAPSLLYIDGRDVFQMPAGLTYGADSLRGRFTGGYSAGQMLLHLNLQPRRMLPIPGSFKVLGNETVEGAHCVHLLYDTSRRVAAGGAPERVISPQGDVLDLWIDPARNAVVRLAYGRSGGPRTECQVSKWDVFGTSAQWPAQLRGVQEGSTLLTDIRFDNNTDALRDARQAAAKPAFFSVPRELLKNSDEYSVPLNNPRLGLSDQQQATARVALAEIAFKKQNLGDGLAQWETVEHALSAAEDRDRLLEVLAPLAAEASWKREGDGGQAPAIMAILAKLLGCTDESWRLISPQLAFTWEALSQNPDLNPDQRAMLTGPVLSRLAAGGNVSAEAELIRLAAASPAVRPSIQDALDRAAKQPLVKGGLAGSTRFSLIAAYTQNGDFDSARRLLGVAPDAAGRGDVQTAIELLGAAGHDARWFNSAARTYAQFSLPPFHSDQSSGVFEYALSHSAANALKAAFHANPDSREIAAIVASADPDSSRFWDAVLHILIRGIKPDDADHFLAPLARAYGQRFGKADYESRTWERIAASFGAAVNGTDAYVRCMTGAVQSAPGDSARASLIVQLAGHLVAAKQYDRAAQAINELGRGIQDPPSRQRLLVAADQVAAAQKAQGIQIDPAERRREAGELAYLQQQLGNLKSANASPADIQSLQNVVDAVRAKLNAP